MADNLWGLVIAGIVGAAIAILGVNTWNNMSESQKRGFLNALGKFRLCTNDEVNIRNAVKALHNSQKMQVPRY
jgi:hypothetical protein